MKLPGGSNENYLATTNGSSKIVSEVARKSSKRMVYIVSLRKNIRNYIIYHPNVASNQRDVANHQGVSPVMKRESPIIK